MILCFRLFFDETSNFCTFPENVTCNNLNQNTPVYDNMV